MSLLHDKREFKSWNYDVRYDCVHDGDVGEETFQRVTLSYRLPLLFWLHVDCNIGMIVCHSVLGS